MSQSVSARQAEEAAAKRRRNMTIAGALLAALVVVGVIIAVSGGSSKKTTVNDAAKLTHLAETKALLDTIPQHGKILGDPKAKVTLIEFADLQCPFCRQFTLASFDPLVQQYVKSGKVKIQLELLTFVGADSLKAARAAAGAAEQNKLWQFAELMYWNQGQENSGYVTPRYIDALYDGAGVDKTEANAFARTAGSKQLVTDAQASSEQYGVVQTPTFVSGAPGGAKDKLENIDIKDVTTFQPYLDTFLK